MKNSEVIKIGNKIKELRESMGLSQEALAEKVQCTYQQISKYERGENAPRGLRLAKIAAALGTTVEQLSASNVLGLVAERPVSYKAAKKHSPLRLAIEDELDKLPDLELSKLLTQLLMQAREEDQGRD